MKNLSTEEVWNFAIMAALLTFYALLTLRFAWSQKTWPLAIYYAGCLVKDSGVMILGLFLSGKS